jgi:hypothetical protein
MAAGGIGAGGSAGAAVADATDRRKEETRVGRAEVFKMLSVLPAWICRE